MALKGDIFRFAIRFDLIHNLAFMINQYSPLSYRPNLFIKPFLKAIWLSFFASIGFFSLFAANLQADARSSPVLDSFICKKDITLEEADSIIKATQEGFNKLNSMKAQFYQDSYLMALDESELSAGSVSLLKPGKMRWHYSTPEEQVFIIKDQDIWLYQPRLNQVMIDTIDKVLISQLPTAFLMGIGDLSKDFTIKSACSGKAGVLLKLTPSATSNDSSNLSNFELLVDAKSYIPVGARVLDVGGNQTSIVLKSVVINDKSIQLKDFEYEFPENLDIDDRRKVTETPNQ